jgi:hypothetical protein
MARWQVPVLLSTLALLVGAADPASAVKCLDDPGDAAQIAATRSAIDLACSCFGAASPGEYTRCTAGVFNQRAAAMQLRNECKGTVKKIYVSSVCGREIGRIPPTGPKLPCVAKSNATGKITCSLRPSQKSGSSLSLQRDECFAHLTCLDAADSNGDVRIAGPGDSGACAALPDTFTDNGDGTISDSRTGLMWEKLSDDGSIHDQDDTYVWSDAFAVKIAALNADSGFAGHTDWRVPTVHELLTLLRVDPDSMDPNDPAIPAEFKTGCTPGCTVPTCSCTRPSSYWSSTETTVDNVAGIDATAVSFELSSAIQQGPKTSNGFVRAVRVFH